MFPTCLKAQVLLDIIKSEKQENQSFTKYMYKHCTLFAIYMITLLKVSESIKCN